MNAAPSQTSGTGTGIDEEFSTKRNNCADEEEEGEGENSDEDVHEDEEEDEDESMMVPVYTLGLYLPKKFGCDWKKLGKANGDPILTFTISPEATFRKLDTAIRALLNKEDHLSHFMLMNTQREALRDSYFAALQAGSIQSFPLELMANEPMVDVNGGSYGFDFLDEFSNNKLSTTKIHDLLDELDLLHVSDAGGGNGGEGGEGDTIMDWRYDNDSMTVVFKLIGSGTKSRSCPPVEVKDPNAAAVMPRSVVPTDGPTFDSAYPSIASNLKWDGGLDMGKGAHPCCWGFLGNPSTNISEQQTPPPAGDVTSVFVKFQNDCRMGHDRVSRRDFNFDATFPKLSKFLCSKARYQWVELGTWRMGPLVQCFKGKKREVVWMSPITREYETIHEALMDLERKL